jgi:hypothetical protein
MVEREIGKCLPTLSLDTEIRFRSAADRTAFNNDLAETVTIRHRSVC